MKEIIITKYQSDCGAVFDYKQQAIDYDAAMKRIESYTDEVIGKKDKLILDIEQAYKNAGLTPVVTNIRGGTDGSRLSFMGLPCPNIFTGEMAIHSKLEYVSVQDMQKAVDVCIEISKIISTH